MEYVLVVGREFQQTQIHTFHIIYAHSLRNNVTLDNISVNCVRHGNIVKLLGRN